MNLKSKDLSALLLTGLCSSLFLLLRFVKMSPILGSSFSFFSFSDMVMPLSGTVGFGFIGLLILLRMGARTLLFGLPFLSPLYFLPGLCASSYWALNNKIMSLIIPLACMVAFLMHPVGADAFVYSLYWFIPMALYFVKEKTIFMHSLASTFIAHSVGSVIWLYANPMDASVWLALIPVVALERFIFAGGMTAVYYAGAFLKERFSVGATVRVQGSLND